MINDIRFSKNSIDLLIFVSVFRFVIQFSPTNSANDLTLLGQDGLSEIQFQSTQSSIEEPYIQINFASKSIEQEY